MDTLSIVPVDRSSPFNTASSMKNDHWVIVEEDERSLALTEVDLDKVRLETMLRRREVFINTPTRLNRLKESGLILLDAKLHQILWEHQYLIPEAWKPTNGKTVYIYFNGTRFKNTSTNRLYCFLCLYSSDGVTWRQAIKWSREHSITDRYMSATLPSINEPSAILRSANDSSYHSLRLQHH